jgi:hypothetical protein
MNFRRTVFGLSNLHRFARVDLVIFTEGGGRTISKVDALGGRTQAAGMDSYFWGELFKKA